MWLSVKVRKEGKEKQLLLKCRSGRVDEVSEDAKSRQKRWRVSALEERRELCCREKCKTRTVLDGKRKTQVMSGRKPQYEFRRRRRRELWWVEVAMLLLLQLCVVLAASRLISTTPDCSPQTNVNSSKYTVLPSNLCCLKPSLAA